MRRSLIVLASLTVAALLLASSASAVGFCGFDFTDKTRAVNYIRHQSSRHPLSLACKFDDIYRDQIGTTRFERILCNARWPWGPLRYTFTNKRFRNGDCGIYVSTKYGSRLIWRG